MMRTFAFQITTLFMLLSFTENAGDENINWTVINFCARTDSEGHYLLPNQQTQDPETRSRDSPESLRSIFRQEREILLGQGSFGTVYKVKALDKKVSDTKKDFAVKVLKDLPTNIREIYMLLLLHDVEGVPRLYECEIAPYSILLRQELLEKDLLDSDNLKYLRGMHLDERLKLFIGALNTLKKIHAKGWIHLDIKPQNMMFADSKRERIYIIDFGMAREKGTKQLGGTIIFMSPEMILKNTSHLVDEGDDIWSFVMSMIDIEIGHIIKLEGPYFNCLNDVIKDNYSREEKMKSCLTYLFYQIKKAFENQKYAPVIGKGCPEDSVRKYKKIILSQIGKHRPYRHEMATLIGELQTIIDECKKDSMSKAEKDAVHLVENLEASQTIKRLDSPSPDDINHDDKSISFIDDPTPTELQKFMNSEEKIRSKNISPAKVTSHDYPNTSTLKSATINNEDDSMDKSMVFESEKFQLNLPRLQDYKKKPADGIQGTPKTDGTEKSDANAHAIRAGAVYFSPSSQAPAFLPKQPKKDRIRI